MTLEDKVRSFQLHALHRAKVLRNVTAARRELGISRTVSYRWESRFKRYGADGLHPTRRSASRGRPSALSLQDEWRRGRPRLPRHPCEAGQDPRALWREVRPMNRVGFPANDSTLSRRALVERVLSKYSLSAPIECNLLNKGVNDTYIVKAGSSQNPSWSTEERTSTIWKVLAVN